ncbi:MULTISPECIES: flagellar brake protein [Bacillales]|jgi:c-di-GMP-binding flagellar brake protein YcgR|uniref:flagellar brake protein n=1 Tax=Brevibacillus TaxID=55080 RepID=UPI000E3693AE|nr:MULTISPECIES: flagellar brake domain-containing protein [Bacillales]NNV02177.1 glycosyltransferase [Brevibacillus sp. MCWH]REK62255.1 MAG: glycosyltransferase [Brevibacillus sp.]UFJ60432.1 flagellar brake domain-containing protein [Anoxybacillus sediminis]
MKLPRIGQTLRLSLVHASEERNGQTFKTRVADLTEEHIVIELPISEATGRTGPFPAGTECNVWYIGDDGSRYEFRTVINGRQSENIPVLLIRKPEKTAVKRTQRRSYLRINTAVEIAVKTTDPVRRYHFLTRTINLSGGGISFTCEASYRLQVKDRLQVWMALPGKNGQVQHAYGVVEIVRCNPAEEKGLHQWISGKFVQISEADRAKIVRACYERQLDWRKKGVLD